MGSVQGGPRSMLSSNRDLKRVPGVSSFNLFGLVTKPGDDSKWREKQNCGENDCRGISMQSLDVYKKEEGKIWQRKPSPSPEEG